MVSIEQDLDLFRLQSAHDLLAHNLLRDKMSIRVKLKYCCVAVNSIKIYDH